MSNRIPRSLGDELSVDRWFRVVNAVQGVWQSETSNGVSVGKSGRLTHWSAFGKSWMPERSPNSMIVMCNCWIPASERQMMLASYRRILYNKTY